MDDIKLRPCPFCGSEAYLIINDGARVLCPKCGATSKILVDNIVGYEPSKNAVKSVIEAWNKRVSDKMQQPIDGNIRWILEWDDAFHEYAEKEVIPETVGQYTGLNDKNGNKIFEGDIVKHYNHYDKPELFEIGTILWSDNKLRFVRTSFPEEVNMENDCIYEVIGNIHDKKNYDKKGDEQP